MKKIFLAVVFVLLMYGLSFAAGSVTVTSEKGQPAGILKVTFTCIGDSGDGTVPNTAVPSGLIQYLTKAKPYNLFEIKAYPTAGGTAPDAASVFLLDANNLDLLGSEDGSTTPYAGLNLIHATLPRSTFPNKHLPRAGSHVIYYPVITTGLTLKVVDQATVSADFTIELIFTESDG